MKSDVWQLRKDLAFRWVNGDNNRNGYWVVKDPLAREWLCLSDTEKQLLALANGRRSAHELCHAAVELIRPLETSLQSMVSFYVQARQKGLLVAVGQRGDLDHAATVHSIHANATGWGRRISGLLAVRFPGINPNRFMTRSGDVLHPFVKRLSICFVLGLVLVAVAIVVAQFDVFSAELAIAFNRRTSRWLVTLLASVAIAKTIHELAHVLACRQVGAECREVGIMLLFGTPCLYCDVSDLWTVPQRSKRIYVSAAGMLAELVLAALAVIVWTLTNQSIAHDVALVLAVVCSVSTVVVNANPLLRYDGYFILSDWIGAPNLADRSGAMVMHRIRRILWGPGSGSDGTLEDISTSEECVASQNGPGRELPTSVFLAFGVASAMYRLFIVGAISLIVYHTSIDWGLGWLGFGFAFFILMSMTVRFLSGVLASPSGNPIAKSNGDGNAKGLRWWQKPRVVVLLVFLAGLVAVIGAVPYSNRIVVPVAFVDLDGQSVQSAESGRLVSWRSSGDKVERGDLLFQLSNDGLQAELVAADAEVTQAEAITSAWRTRKGIGQGTSGSLAIVEKRLIAARERRQQIAGRVERLSVRADRSGMFFASFDKKDQDAESLAFTDGRFRRGQFIAIGTSLGWVGHPRRRSGVALVPQIAIDQVRQGQSVLVRHASVDVQHLSGTIRHVQRYACQSIPPDFLDASEPENSSESKYLVRIEFAESDPVAMPLRSNALAEIHADAKGSWTRLRRWVSTEFRGL